MGTAWQAFLEGALEPGRRVAIDKPAPGLWLQVLSIRLFGFHEWALLLPAALGGVAAVAALMWVVRAIAGRWAGLAAGAALAVMPAARVTARRAPLGALNAAVALGALRRGLGGGHRGGLAAAAPPRGRLGPALPVPARVPPA